MPNDGIVEARAPMVTVTTVTGVWFLLQMNSMCGTRFDNCTTLGIAIVALPEC
jgi:hypothetical protein